MATTNGTATDYLNLMALFNTFVTGLGGGNAWTALRATSTEYIWQAPGSLGSPADPLTIGAKAFFNVGGDYYNWRLGGFVNAFDSGLAFELQPGFIGAQLGSQSSPVLNCWNASIPYRFYATGRRAIILAKISTVYVTAYLGYLQSYMAPGAFPYPLVVGGSMAWDGAEPSVGDARWRWSYGGGELSNFPIPNLFVSSNYGSSLRLRRPDGVWIGFDQTSDPTFGSGKGAVWPYKNWGTGSHAADLRDNLGGGYMLLPIVITDASANIYGELDGIFALTGFGNAAENTVTIGGVAHYVVPNVFRTSQTNYFAIKEA
jgi:hypothetical protein